MYDESPSTPPGIRRDASFEALVLANVALRFHAVAGSLRAIAGKLDSLGPAERAYVLDQLHDELREVADAGHDTARACNVAAREYAPEPPGKPRAPERVLRVAHARRPWWRRLLRLT